MALIDIYNPDWAVLVEIDGIKRLYFVVETKSSLSSDDLLIKKMPKSNVTKRILKRWVREKILLGLLGRQNLMM